MEFYIQQLNRFNKTILQQMEVLFYIPKMNKAAV